MTTVVLGTVQGDLTLVYCPRCDLRRWSLRGEATPIGDLLSVAQRKRTRHLIVVPPMATAA